MGLLLVKVYGNKYFTINEETREMLDLVNSNDKERVYTEVHALLKVHQYEDNE